MKKKCLLVWKWPIYAQIFLVNKFSKFYDVEQVFISDFKNKVFSEIIDDINLLIEAKNIEIVFFDVDFNKLINFFFIKKYANGIIKNIPISRPIRRWIYSQKKINLNSSNVICVFIF